VVETKRAFASTTLTADAVVAKIESAYAAQLRRCFREASARAPSVRGTVLLGFDVTRAGETAAVKISAAEPGLEACIAGLVAAWRFSIPRGDFGRDTARFEVGYRFEVVRKSDSASLEEEARRYADLLVGEPSGGTAGDLSRRRPPSSDLSQQLADVRNGGSQVAVGGGGGRGGRAGTAGTGSVRGGGGGGGQISGPSAGSGGGGVVSTGPAGRVLVSSKLALEATSLDADVVLAKVQAAYMAGIKRCYRERLKQDPTARGAVALRFVVNEAGRAESAKVTSFEASLGTCIEGMMATWRFAVPKDRGGDPTTASFVIELMLTPD
jgi:hypothetical protein